MAASFSLIIEDDAGKQIVVPFAKDVITIGRKEGNTIRLTERNVSRFHAKLSKEAGHVVVEDLTSFNGVKLNGDRIAGRVEVGSGDVIEIGDYHLELRSAQPTTAATTQKLGPAGARSATIDEHPAADDDDFEGDTQRWEPPTASGAGQLPTVEMAPPRPPSLGNDADTERIELAELTMPSAPPPSPPPAQAWPPPPRAATDADATVRQPVAPAASVAPSPDEDDVEATQDMPLPAVVQARANLQAQGLGVRREAAVEQTEQLRIAPVVAAIDDLALPRLVVLNTIFAGSTFPLRAMENVLGRTDDNDIVLEHRSVSRNHAKLVREGERVRILDLKSANGVLVNGDEVEQHVLKGGDVIELGRVRIRFVPVGERFVVSPEDIERARIADASGSDEDNSQTAAVSPLREPAAAKKPLVLYAILAVLVLLVVVLGGIVLSRGGGEPAPTVPAATVGAVAPAPPAAVAPTAPAPPNVAVAAAAVVGQPVASVVEPPKPPVERAPRSPDPEVDSDAQLEEARRALFTNDGGKVVKLLADLARQRPRDARVQVMLAAGYRVKGESAKAKQHYEAYLELQPTGAEAEKVRTILKSLP
jgi:pSer/pThr/pTyr-binding forkhead associated (FHA) protein